MPEVKKEQPISAAVERLTAERDRLREAIEAHRRWKQAKPETYGVGHLDHGLWAALGESPVPDEPTACEYLPDTIGAECHCTHWQEAVDAEVSACCWCGTDEDDAGSCPGPAAPSHPTGEERDR